MERKGSSAWPAIEYEEREWTAARNDALLDVWQRHRLSRPYHAALLPPVANSRADISRDLLALVDEATSEVARFDTRIAELPVTMPAVLLRTESASSSQIEHLTANARNLAMASLGVGAKQNAELVAANVRAMSEALRLGDEVTVPQILAVHRTLLTGSEPDVAGRLRDEQVWIGSSPISPHDADFVPPHHERVEAALDDLVRFAARRRDLVPLVHAALVHAQFETIHPFTDGNGRTGRVVLQTVLRSRGLTRHATVPVSAGLLRDPDRYFRALTAYRTGDLDPIVRQVADAALAATANGRELSQDVLDIREAWRSQLAVRSDSAAWRLVDELFAQPVVNAGYVASVLDVSDRSARNAIDALEKVGILTPARSVRRHQVWQASSVLTAMDAFAQRAGRRG
ncbi:Fic family protein [Myceligenerans sp. I2]|uniref:Fic family protein n=2 Tax=Myceligenerans indicum TaxID=2593663 RepID=A0ABS1LKV9_9MICO|nr:Fic family protein [Myceligenerans indicum]